MDKIGKVRQLLVYSYSSSPLRGGKTKFFLHRGKRKKNLGKSQEFSGMGCF